MYYTPFKSWALSSHSVYVRFAFSKYGGHTCATCLRNTWQQSRYYIVDQIRKSRQMSRENKNWHPRKTTSYTAIFLRIISGYCVILSRYTGKWDRARKIAAEFVVSRKLAVSWLFCKILWVGSLSSSPDDVGVCVAKLFATAVPISDHTTRRKHRGGYRRTTLTRRGGRSPAPKRESSTFSWASPKLLSCYYSTRDVTAEELSNRLCGKWSASRIGPTRCDDSSYRAFTHVVIPASLHPRD